MRDLVYVGSSPPEEDCAQVGSDGYDLRARGECHAYMNLLRRVLGAEPEGASLSVKSCPHDFGDYLEVVCHFDPEKPDAVEYALRCEAEGPPRWDAEALRELNPSTRKEI
jgi:hypothetical protein